MYYYCDVCDKTSKTKSQKTLLRSLTHNEFEKPIRIKDTIQSPVFFV